MISSSMSGATTRKGSAIITAHVRDGKVVTTGGSKIMSPQLNTNNEKPRTPNQGISQIPVIKSVILFYRTYYFSMTMINSLYTHYHEII